ncbi:MAG TPA: YbjN domain-containing protein [Candidatus Elarobacter sp.]|jgi:hypothetical protein|nr:YbjN domain-containing protein [Candidatus Elarobacter sp.]
MEANSDSANGDVEARAKAALAVVRTALGKLDLTPQPVDGVDAYFVDFDDERFEGAVAQVVSTQSRFAFYIDFKEHATSATAPASIEFITRANNGLLIGNFEFDIQDGVVRLKSSLDYTGLDLSERLVENAVRGALEVGTVYGWELVNVLRGTKRAEDAIADAERESNV